MPQKTRKVLLPVTIYINSESGTFSSPLKMFLKVEHVHVREKLGALFLCKLGTNLIISRIGLFTLYLPNIGMSFSSHENLLQFAQLLSDFGSTYQSWAFHFVCYFAFLRVEQGQGRVKQNGTPLERRREEKIVRCSDSFVLTVNTYCHGCFS